VERGSGNGKLRDVKVSVGGGGGGGRTKDEIWKGKIQNRECVL
jgi:hypothetical protein